MRVSIYSDQAKTACFCPFALPERVYCLGDDCMSWESDDEFGDGTGDCSLLMHRREVINRTDAPLHVLHLDV